MARLRVAMITLFPEMFSAITESGITRRALERGLFELSYFNPRAFTQDKHSTVDDRPYGGGPGMVMLIEPLNKALQSAFDWLGVERNEVRVIYMSPQGTRLKRAVVKSLSRQENLVIIAGRYEGIDERFVSAEVDEEISIGDYVLSGGELPAMVLMDALIRRIPGALGDNKSAEQDSFENGLLDCPHYTRPEVYDGVKVPDVLLSGDHKRIERWRKQQSLVRTYERRPDLLENLDLTEGDKLLLNEHLKSSR